MRAFTLFVFLFMFSNSYSQNYQRHEITLISPSRDTLWILNNEAGRLIASSWESPVAKIPEKDKPVILIVDQFPAVENVTDKRYIRGNK